MEYASKYLDYVNETDLEGLQEKDLYLWNNGFEIYKSLSEDLSEKRMDYFDISYGTHERHKLDIHHLKENQTSPVILFIHGGGWMSSDKSQTRFAGPTWLDLGYTVVSINHRLSPEISHPAHVEDCALALKWVIDHIQEYGGDPQNISIIGHSSGAHLAALLLTDIEVQGKYNIDTKNIKCAIVLSGIYDFNLPENYYHPLMAEYISAFFGEKINKEDASPVNHITAKEPPFVILHGENDWLVPRSNSIIFYNALINKGAEAELEVIEDYRHTNLLITYGEPNHRPTEIINKYLNKYMPIWKKDF